MRYNLWCRPLIRLERSLASFIGTLRISELKVSVKICKHRDWLEMKRKNCLKTNIIRKSMLVDCKSTRTCYNGSVNSGFRITKRIWPPLEDRHWSCIWNTALRSLIFRPICGSLAEEKLSPSTDWINKPYSNPFIKVEARPGSGQVCIVIRMLLTIAEWQRLADLFRRVWWSEMLKCMYNLISYITFWQWWFLHCLHHCH